MNVFRFFFQVNLINVNLFNEIVQISYIVFYAFLLSHFLFLFIFITPLLCRVKLTNFVFVFIYG